MMFWIKVISLRGDDIGFGRSCHFWPSVYIFATYEGVSALAHRQQTQTDGITHHSAYFGPFFLSTSQTEKNKCQQITVK